MTSRSTKALLVAVTITALAGGLVAGGYALGRDGAPSEAEARRAQADSERKAFATARQTARKTSEVRGTKAGAGQGKLRGSRQGRREGLSDGRAEAEAVRSQQTAAAEAQRREEIEALANERARNCGAPLFADGYCPTDEEIEREGQAESLCGPGTAEGRRRADELGIDC